MFEKVLIAGRGEIAIRVARTCERLGIATVAVHGAHDAEALHVSNCDEAVSLPDSNITAQHLVDAARATGAQAIHPCYVAACGNAALARASAEAGITFVGAPADVIECFQDRTGARAQAIGAGVRTLPSASAASGDLADLHDLAHALGYPVLLRSRDGQAGATASDEEELAEALTKTRAALGDLANTVTLERLLDRPRVLEVELVADTHGQCIALGDRESSLRYRSDVLLDESPSPALIGSHGEFKREILANAATRVAMEGGLVGAGSARFLMDDAGQLHFAAFVPALSDSHALAEMCTGLDLVELSLLIAAGEKLSQEVVLAQASGHAAHARIRADLTAEGAATVPIETLRWPSVAPGALRVETGVQPGTPLSHIDSDLVARVFTYAPTRHHALLTLDRVLAETTIAPHETNLAPLRRALGDESFRAGQYDVGFVDRLLASSEA